MSESPALVAERQVKLDALGPRPPWWRWLARRRWRRAHAAIMAMDVSLFADLMRAIYSPGTIRDLAARYNGRPPG